MTNCHHELDFVRRTKPCPSNNVFQDKVVKAKTRISCCKYYDINHLCTSNLPSISAYVYMEECHMAS